MVLTTDIPVPRGGPINGENELNQLWLTYDFNDFMPKVCNSHFNSRRMHLWSSKWPDSQPGAR